MGEVKNLNIKLRRLWIDSIPCIPLCWLRECSFMGSHAKVFDMPIRETPKFHFMLSIISRSPSRIKNIHGLDATRCSSIANRSSSGFYREPFFFCEPKEHQRENLLELFHLALMDVLHSFSLKHLSTSTQICKLISMKEKLRSFSLH